MKAFLLVCISATFATSAMAATYEVPVTAELREYAIFNLIYFEKKVDGNKFKIKYDLPKMLTGEDEKIELEGTYIEGSEVLTLSGDKATAKCTGVDSTKVSCIITYDSLDIDLERAAENIRKASATDQEFAARLEVMRAFSTDPVGIITY